MNTREFFIAMFAMALCVTTNAQNFEWAKQLGGSGQDTPLSIKTDAAGNVYTTGYFGGTTDFDPGAGTFNLTSLGDLDIFVSKLDASGNFVWAKQIGGLASQLATSIGIDAAGNLYITGYFQGTADFDPGAGIFNLTAASVGSSDIFVFKLDASGNFVWAKQMGGLGGDGGYAMAVDAAGNTYITGGFEQTVDFDPGVGTFSLTAVGPVGFNDIFVSKLDASGNFVWAKQMGGLGSQQGNAIALDASGNVYTTGYFQSTTDFDPGAGIFNLTATGTSYDVFISKLDATGNFIWAKQLAVTNFIWSNGIAVDASGNVYTTGYYGGTVDFDPGAGTFNLPLAGNIDIFISKLDASGNFIWAKQMGGTSGDVGYSIATDASGNVYSTGYFGATVDFDPGAGTFNLTSLDIDVFVSKLDAFGNFVWAKQMGGTLGTVGRSIALDASGNIYTTGFFSSTVDFDPGQGTFNLISNAGADGFVHKMSQCAITTGVDIVNTCNSYRWIDGNTYIANNNTATFTLTNTVGCDSIVTLNLTVNPIINTSLNDTICPGLSYMFNGQSLSVGGTYYDTLTASSGCDSIITLNLTIDPVINTTLNETICFGESYNFNGQLLTVAGIYNDTLPSITQCISIATLNLSVLPNLTSVIDTTICNGDSLEVGGNVYYQGGTYNIPLLSQIGCDSSILLKLGVFVLDTLVNTNGNIISSAQNGAQYQWINCDDNTIINNADQQSYTVLQNGVYAVIINDGSCIDTSACVQVFISGIAKNQESSFAIYPNPAKDWLQVTGITEATDIHIYNIQGKLIWSIKNQQADYLLNLKENSISSSMYIVEITSGQFKEYYKLFVE